MLKLPKIDRPFLAQWLLLGLSLSILSGFVIQYIYIEYQRIDATERKQLLAQASIIDQNIVAQLESINLVLASLRSEIDEWKKSKNNLKQTIRHLTILTDAMPGVRTILITDAQGTITTSSRESIIGQNFKNREYFKAALNNPSPDTLYISPPFTTSLGVYSMSITRAIIGKDGHFSGVISATLDPVQFEVLMNSVLHSQDMWASLVHGTGSVFMLVPPQPETIGKNLAQPGTFFTRHMESGALTNVFSGVTYATDKEHMAALRTINTSKLHMDQPLIIFVSRDLSGIFASWQRVAYIQTSLLTMLVLISVFSLIFYQRKQTGYLTERKQAEAEKEEAHFNQQALFDAIQETILLINVDGTVLTINKIGAKRLQTTPKLLLGKNILDQFPIQAAASRREKFADIAQKGQPDIFEDERSGHRFLNAIYPIADSKGATQRLAIYAADITRQHRQKVIDNILSGINQEILQGVPLEDVLHDICKKMADAFQLELVWLGRKESGGEVSVMAAAGLAAAYIDAMKKMGVRWDDTAQGRGPAGSAIRFGEPVAYRANDPRFKTWASLALDMNLQSIFAIPLVIRSEIYGVFVVYSSDPALFDSTEFSNELKHIAKRICIALETAMEQQQVRLLSSALEAAGNGILVTDPQGIILWVNQAFIKLCGYSRAELLGETPRLLKSGQQSPEYYQALWSTISKGGNWSSETIERAKDGSVYTVSQTITPIFNNGKLTHFISIHEDISAQKLSQERIQHLAHFDALTSLPNRTLFFDRLSQAVALAKRNKSGLALMYLDLDGFKKINDSMGHHAGDLLLIAVAERLRKCIRGSDTVARLGGDEFTIVLNETVRDNDVTGVAKKIIASLAEPFELEGKSAKIGISIGIAQYSETANNEETLIKLADAAMYEAKSAGKNTYRLA